MIVDLVSMMKLEPAPIAEWRSIVTNFELKIYSPYIVSTDQG